MESCRQFYIWASFPCWDIHITFSTPYKSRLSKVTKLPPKLFMLFRVPLTHLDYWLAFFKKFPRHYICSWTTITATWTATTSVNVHTICKREFIFPKSWTDSFWGTKFLQRNEKEKSISWNLPPSSKIEWSAPYLKKKKKKITRRK